MIENQERQVFIIGAGVMGIDTALDCAKHGYNVIINDQCKDTILQGIKKLKKAYRYAAIMTENYGEVSWECIQSRIVFQDSFESIDRSYIIIENVTENLLAKQSVYNTIKNLISEESIIAINTSCLSITKLAASFNNQSRVIGMHLMNPVYLKTSAEVIKGYHTTDKTVNFIEEFLSSMLKQAIVIDDFPGFVSNRLSHLYMNEAAFIVQDGIATARQIDDIMKKGFSHKMGPLETADLIGLDTIVNSLNVLYESFQDTKFKCCPLLKKMVDAGMLGFKSGKGFYDYE